MLRKLLEEASLLMAHVQSSENADAHSVQRATDQVKAVEIGWPVGQMLYDFDCDDGIRKYLVVGEKELLRFGMIRWATPELIVVLRPTVEEAIKAKIAELRRVESEESLEGIIESLEEEVEYYGNQFRHGELALKEFHNQKEPNHGTEAKRGPEAQEAEEGDGATAQAKASGDDDTPLRNP